MQPSKWLALVTVIGAALAAAGCAATMDDEPVGYATVTAAPVDIETYPSVMYQGEPVYFYGGRWWHRDGDRGRWSYYRDEPAYLHGQRAVIAHRPRAPVHPER